MQEALHIFAVMKLASPATEETLAELAKLMKASRAEPGCLEYEAHVPAEDDTPVFMFKEAWKDEAAFKSHVESAHFLAWRDFAGPFMDEPPAITVCKRLAF